MKWLKKALINLSKKYKPLGTFLRHTRIFLKRLVYLYYYFTNKTDDKLVVFQSFNGRNFSDNPKSLYLEMLNDKKYKDYKYVWLFKNVEDNKKYLKGYKNTIIVKDRSRKAYKYYSRAKYIIVNAVLHEEIIRRNDQVFVQCWHGTPLKCLRCDIKYDSNLLRTKKEIKRTNDKDVKRFNYFISPSKFASEKFISSFNLKELNKEDIIIETGYPRNDDLFDITKKQSNDIKKKLGLPKNKKVILYAPTFRDNQYNSGSGFCYNLGIDLDKIQSEISDEYVLLFRTHYYVTNQLNLKKYKGFIFDVSNYNDINDLYITSDILITDYSSVFFDYANLKRPILFYMYDLEEYKNKLRDFYMDLKILPGPIIQDEESLIKSIKNINIYYDLYNNKYKKFNKKFNYLDGRNCSKRVLDIIIGDDK